MTEQEKIKKERKIVKLNDFVKELIASDEEVQKEKVELDGIIEMDQIVGAYFEVKKREGKLR